MIQGIILIAMFTLSLGIKIAKHGEKDDEPINAMHSIISYILVVGLLCFSGIFD